jgi:hypothetical protein
MPEVRKIIGVPVTGHQANIIVAFSELSECPPDEFIEWAFNHGLENGHLFRARRARREAARVKAEKLAAKALEPKRPVGRPRQPPKYVCSECGADPRDASDWNARPWRGCNYRTDEGLKSYHQCADCYEAKRTDFHDRVVAPLSKPEPVDEGTKPMHIRRMPDGTPYPEDLAKLRASLGLKD